MSTGLVGHKCGMTRIFEGGAGIPVTVVKVLPHFVTQLKCLASDGYSAIQVTTGEKKPSRVKKPVAGQFKKAGVLPGVLLRELRCTEEAVAQFKLGQKLDITQFKVGQRVDVRGLSRGKGFAGVVKRHGFAMQDATHGNSVSHRASGSTGQCQDPGRVFKGKKMAGRMGGVWRSALSLEIISVDVDQHILCIKGSLPGVPKGVLLIKPSVKNRKASSNDKSKA